LGKREKKSDNNRGKRRKGTGKTIRRTCRKSRERGKRKPGNGVGKWARKSIINRIDLGGILWLT